MTEGVWGTDSLFKSDGTPCNTTDENKRVKFWKKHRNNKCHHCEYFQTTVHTTRCVKKTT